MIPTISSFPFQSFQTNCYVSVPPLGPFGLKMCLFPYRGEPQGHAIVWLNLPLRHTNQSTAAVSIAVWYNLQSTDVEYFSKCSR